MTIGADPSEVRSSSASGSASLHFRGRHRSSRTSACISFPCGCDITSTEARRRPDLPSERGDKSPVGHTGLKPRYRRGGAPPRRSRDEALSLPSSWFLHAAFLDPQPLPPSPKPPVTRLPACSLCESSAFSSPFTGCRDDPWPPRCPG